MELGIPYLGHDTCTKQTNRPSGKHDSFLKDRARMITLLKSSAGSIELYPINVEKIEYSTQFPTDMQAPLALAQGSAA
jgi:hypothetical protein